MFPAAIPSATQGGTAFWPFPGKTEAWWELLTCPTGTRTLQCSSQTVALPHSCPMAPQCHQCHSPGPTCALCWRLAGREAEPQVAVVPKVSQHIQGWLHFIRLVHGADVVREDVADLTRSCHEALCREMTVSPRGGSGTQAHGTCSTPASGWVRSGCPSLLPSSPLRSLLQKYAPSTCWLGLGPDSPPPQGPAEREAEPERTGDVASPCF